MVKAVILALAASFCTATSSVCQRLGAAAAPGGESLSPRLFLYLVRQPVWLAGIASMILGTKRVVRHDWMAAAAMAAGLAVFLFAASPSGGHLHAQAASWWFAGVSALGLALIA